MISRNYDCLIIGAGPSGLSCAIRLAQGGWKVGLVERLGLPREKVCGGFIGPENREILESLGVYDQISTVAARLSRLSLHAAEGTTMTLPLSSPTRSHGGLGLSRAAFDEILLNRARQLGVDIYDGCNYALQYEEGTKIVTLNTRVFSERVRTRQLIQATGASKSGKRAGVGSGALFGNCQTPADEVSLYFVQGGHLGVNRFESGMVNACYVAEAALFERCGKSMPAVFEHFLRSFPSLKEQFVGAKQLNDFKGISVCRSSAPRFSREGNFLVGDAVDVINPVVGGGNSLALASGIILADTLLKYPKEIPFRRLIDEYGRVWKRAFASRISASWALGYLSHQHFLARQTIRLFQWREQWLRQIFEHLHQPPEFQC